MDFLNLESPSLGLRLEPVSLFERRRSPLAWTASLEALPHMVWMRDSSQEIVYVNQKWVEYSGLSLEETNSIDKAGVIHPEDFSEVNSKWKEAIYSQKELRLHCRYRRRKDGQYRWHEVRGVPVRDALGQVAHWIGTATEIHEQKRVVERLHLLSRISEILASSLEVERNLSRAAKSVLPSLGDCAFLHLLDNEGSLRPAEVVLRDGIQPGTLQAFDELGRVLGSRGPASPVEAALISRQIQVRSDLLHEYQRRIAWDDRHLELMRLHHPTSVACVPLLSRDQIFGVFTVGHVLSAESHDADDVRLLEEIARHIAVALDNSALFHGVEELLEAREALLCREQAAVKHRDEFLSIASHELKTPITALRLQLQLARRRIDSGERVETVPLLDTTLKQVNRLTVLVEDLLDVSRIQSGKLSFHFDETQLSELVEQVLDRFALQLRLAECPVTLTIEPGIVGIFDRTRIEQVVANLLSNATKYASGHPVHVALFREGGAARLVVSDGGPGIPGHKIPVIFDRFERAITSRKISGLGLGLYIVRQIVKAHRGTVDVESVPGTGCRFTVTLPLDPSQARIPSH